MTDLKMYFILLMKDNLNGVFDAVVKSVLSGISFFYGLAIRVVDVFYRVGVKRKYNVGVPVISVGNITLGGTGKTPFTISLADICEEAGKRPAILTRGYGGDEYKIMRETLVTTPVFVGQDRVANARKAVREGMNVIILDDGFQHRRIARDLDVLLLDSGEPFGNGRLFPRGLLREPIASVKRADIIVFTKSERLTQEKKKELEIRIRRLAPGKPLVWAQHKPKFFTDTSGEIVGLDIVKGAGISAVSGIGDPAYFERMLKDLGGEILSSFRFADHHDFSDDDIRNIEKKCREKSVRFLVTTHKDYVRLRDKKMSVVESKILVLHIEMEMIDGKDEFVRRLNSCLSR